MPELEKLTGGMIRETESVYPPDECRYGAALSKLILKKVKVWPSLISERGPHVTDVRSELVERDYHFQ